MKKFMMLLLGVFFVTLIAGSTQSVTADHLEPGQGIYKDENNVNHVSTKDSKYQMHIQIQVRNEQGQLVSISEADRGEYIPHEITDYAFNENTGKKEIVTIDNMKYEKVQYTDTFDIKQLEHTIDPVASFFGSLSIDFCAEIGGHGFRCLPIFHTKAEVGVISETDVITHQWTLLRELN